MWLATALVVVQAASAAISATVVDPAGRPIAQAPVELTCGDRRVEARTDAAGRFIVQTPTNRSSCQVFVVVSGFEPVRLPVPDDAVPWRIQLRIAAVRETVDVRGNLGADFGALTTSVFSKSDLGASGRTSAAMLDYARILAGNPAGEASVYVDGVPSQQLPPSSAISGVAIDLDTFSARWADAAAGRVEVSTVVPDRRWRWSAGGLAPLATGWQSAGSSAISTLAPEIGVSGGLPRLPFTFQAALQFERNRRRNAFLAGPFLSSLAPQASLPAAIEDEDARSQIFFSVHHRTGAGRTSVSFSDADSRSTNIGPTEVTLESARLSARSRATSITATVERDGRRVKRSHVLAFSLDRDRTGANADGQAIEILDTMIAGGAPALATSSRAFSMFSMHRLESAAARKRWDAGVSLAYTRFDASMQPNTGGRLIFGRMEDYVAALGGEATGVRLVETGVRDNRASSFDVALFADRVLLSAERASVRAGVRLDVERGDGVTLSPRIAGVRRVGAWVLRAGAGMFVKPSSARTLALASWPASAAFSSALVRRAGFETPPAFQDQVAIRGVVAPGFTRTRTLVFRAGVERSGRGWTAGVEHTWMDERHLAGSIRLEDVNGLADTLDSNRRGNRQSLQARARLAMGRASLMGRYTIGAAHDNTDGPFSFPARQADLVAEWAPSSRVPRHAGMLNLDVRGPAGLRLTLLGTWRARTRHDVRSGIDVEGIGLFTDRGGAPRNAAFGPPFRSVDLMGTRRFAVGRILPLLAAGASADVGFRLSNVFDVSNYSRYGSVVGSPMFGAPLGRLGCRSLSVWLALGRD